MKKARLSNGQVILAHQYNAKAHGADLCCADPNCKAKMGYKKEAITHGAQALKDAHFFSRNVKDHAPECRAHDGLTIPAKTIQSLEKSLRENKATLINLNFDLTGTFNNTVKKRNLVCQVSNYGVHNYKAVGVKSVEDILKVIETISKHGDPLAFDRAYVNYKGTKVPFKDFVIDGTRGYANLFSKMQGTLERQKGAVGSVSDFPRLIAFRATAAAKKDQNTPLRGTPITLTNGASKLVLLQHADADKSFDTAIRGENLYMIAEPWLDAGENAAAMKKAKAEGSAFLNLHWKIISVNQFMPEPKPPVLQQGKFNF